MRVLFIGNSHTYFNDMPATFASLWTKTCGETPDVTMLAYSSRSLEWHETEYFAVRFNLMYGHYDYCIIQQQAHPFPGMEETESHMQLILRLCRQAGTVPLLVETWAEQASPEHQKAMADAYRALSAKYGVPLVPVGSAWEELLHTHPEIPLFWKDGEHASPYGDYLIAAALCAVITGDADTVYPTDAHDFIRDGDIDFAHPAVIEDAARTAFVMDPAAADVICKTIGKHIRENSSQQ